MCMNPQQPSSSLYYVEIKASVHEPQQPSSSLYYVEIKASVHEPTAAKF